MNKKLTHVAVYICLALGFSVSTAFAELGLAGMTSENAASAVKAAVANEYGLGVSQNKSAIDIKDAIKAILIEAAQTGDQDIIEAAVASVIQAGFEAGFVSLSQVAVNEAAAENSALATPSISTIVVNTMTVLSSSASPGVTGDENQADFADGDTAGTPI